MKYELEVAVGVAGCLGEGKGQWSEYCQLLPITFYLSHSEVGI